MNKEPSPYFIQRNVPAPNDQAILPDPGLVVEEPGNGLGDYWRTIRCYRWLVLACVFTALLCGALYSFTRTPLYLAYSTILIDPKPPQVLKNQDAVSEYIDQDQYYKTQYQILKSRDLASGVIRDEGLEAATLFPRAAQAPGRVDRTGGTNRETGNTEPRTAKVELVDGYLSMLDVKPVAETRLVRIGFLTPDPVLSARLANAHANGYVRHGIDLRSRTNEEVADLLQKKLFELRNRVQESEAALNKYRRDKGIVSLDEKSSSVTDRLGDLNARLLEVEAERIALEARLEINRNPNLPAPFSNNPSIQGIKAELAKLEAEYALYSKDFKPGYPRLEKLQAQIDNARRQLSSEVRAAMREAESSYAVAKNRENQLRVKIEEEKKSVLSLKDAGVQYAILAREVDTNRQLYDSVLQRMKEAGVAAEVRTPNVYVIEKVETPKAPSYPDKRQTLLFSLLVGLVGGIGLAFLLEQFNSPLDSPDKVERYIGLPSLAAIPDFSKFNGGALRYPLKLIGYNGSKAQEGSTRKELVSSRKQSSVAMEAYRALRASTLLSRAGEPPQTVLIASAIRGEGKTVSVINTAVVFAQLGARVLVVDADFRRPRCHKVLKMRNKVGLAQVLTGQADIEKGVRPTATQNLFFIGSGGVPPNPAELLGSRKMYDTLQVMREGFDFIFIDSSPLIAVSDAVLLSTMVDGVILVIDGQKTTRQVVKAARVRLRNVHTRILGVLINKANSQDGEYKYYYDYYSSEKDHLDKTKGNRPQA